MLASTRGPSMNPAWAATTSRPPSEKSVAITKAPPNGHPGDELLDQHRVQRLALDGAHVPEQVADQQAAGGDRQRGRHVEHRALAVSHARLLHDRHAVGDRLDAGVGAAAEGVGVQEEQRHRAEPEAGGGEPGVEAVGGRPRRVGDRRGAPEDPADQHDAWVPRKSRKIGSSTFTDSLTPRMFRVISATMQTISKPIFPACQSGREEAEERVAGRGDRDGDRQHVVDEQRAARDHAPARARGASWRPGSRRRRAGSPR